MVPGDLQVGSAPRSSVKNEKWGRRDLAVDEWAQRELEPLLDILLPQTNANAANPRARMVNKEMGRHFIPCLASIPSHVIGVCES
jgi:hypothetical protein